MLCSISKGAYFGSKRASSESQKRLFSLLKDDVLVNCSLKIVYNVLGDGCWVLGDGCWVMGVGCWVLGVG